MNAGAHRPPLITIVGPTAVGKSAVGLALAPKLRGEIISADSMQVYRGMDIGTAKPTPAEQGCVKHRLIDVADPNELFCVARYQELARAAIREIWSEGRMPIMVGGTGLYVDATVRGFLFPDEGRNEQIRAKLEQEAAAVGNAVLYSRLSEVDPAAAARIHPNDLRRMVRALEVYEVTGTPITELQRLHEGESEFDVRQFGLRMNRDLLNERIDARVDDMIDAGLLDEVRALVARGCEERFTALQAIGYKELAAFLDGREGLDEAVETVKSETRKYAKRQMTWFRKNRDIHWLDVDGSSCPNEIADEIITILGGWLEEVDYKLDEGL
ncbi:MAG: tRNA (adenosine(37)-N6)-dimethylallyltransferase MiaA [Clostridia bacterium]|nr:tRNA (adenosine(37)-N6)-dimethylallyltransferase MiaA [Clostridia bacterium]